MNSLRPDQPRAVRPILAVVVPLVFFTIFGFWYYDRQKVLADHTAERGLRSIGQMKAEQIQQWRDERLHDAVAIAENQVVSNRLAEYFQGSTGSSLPPDLRSWLRTVQAIYGYGSIFLLDANLRLRYSSTSDNSHFAVGYKAVERAMIAGKPSLSDLLLDDETGHIFFQLVAPLVATAGSDGEIRAVGALVFRIDPQVSFFPMLRGWPTVSKSGEILLVRRDGNDVLYLAELRYRRTAPLTFKLPLARQD